MSATFSFVVTGKAKARIRRFVRLTQREQYGELGRQLLEKAFRQERNELTDKAFHGVLKRFTRDTVADLYAAVGQGHHTARDQEHRGGQAPDRPVPAHDLGSITRPMNSTRPVRTSRSRDTL